VRKFADLYFWLIKSLFFRVQRLSKGNFAVPGGPRFPLQSSPGVKGYPLQPRKCLTAGNCWRVRRRSRVFMRLPKKVFWADSQGSPSPKPPFFGRTHSLAAGIGEDEW